eukprot:4524-Pyramimonas_sp.AAC.1
MHCAGLATVSRHGGPTKRLPALEGAPSEGPLLGSACEDMAAKLVCWIGLVDAWIGDHEAWGAEGV